MILIKESREGVVFSVYVQPRSSKLAIVGLHDDALKIKLTAPPVGGAANKQCIQLLSKTLGLAKSHISITGGMTHRKKQIRIAPPNKPLASSDRSAIKIKLFELAQKSS